jgi:hypothetical protein
LTTWVWARQVPAHNLPTSILTYLISTVNV